MDPVYWFLIIIGGLILYRFILVFLPYVLFPTFSRDLKIKKNKKVERIAKKLMMKNKEKTLEEIFNFTQNRYTSEVYNEFLHPRRHFYVEIQNLLDKSMFLPCHIQNLIMRSLLIATGQFSADDFKRKSILGGSGAIHQYMIIRVGEKTFKADPFYNKLEEIKEQE